MAAPRLDSNPMTGAGSLLGLIRNGDAVTRANLVRHTGLARSTVAQRLDALLANQLVYEAGGSVSTGGRPPTVLAFSQGAGVVLVADLGATHSRLEAAASGRALAADLTAAGLPADSSRDVVGLVRAGEPRAIQAVRDAGRHLGEVLAECLNFFNPGTLVIGGDIAEAHQQLLAGVREVIFQRSLPLATGDLRIVPSRLGDRAGGIGAAIMVLEHILAPDAIDSALGGKLSTLSRS
jgi:predicted NBD/HSP70 family sugar kinase